MSVETRMRVVQGQDNGRETQDATLLQQRNSLQQMARGHRPAQVLLTCVELGVFEALAGRRATAAEVAAAIGASGRGTELLLNAATALGLLVKQDDHFSNGAAAENCLVPDTSGNMLRSMQLESAFARRWGHLAEAVRTGRRPEENRRDEEPDDWVRNFVHALNAHASPVAPFIAQAIDLPVARSLRLIDVGGCHGAYSLALARRYPLLTATVYELPRVVPVARELIAESGLAERVSVQEGDFQREELGRGYDVALVFGVLNGEPPEGRPALIRKVFTALNSGGRIILRDSVLDPDRAGPLEATIFALQMLLATESGGLDTRDEWNRWLQQVGFQAPYTISLPSWVGSTLTVAVKPSNRHPEVL